MNVPSIDDYPAIKWLIYIWSVATISVTCGMVFVYLEDFQRGQVLLHDAWDARAEEERVGDTHWIELDRRNQRVLEQQGDEVITAMRALEARFDSDGSLVYRIGLRDGLALCQSGGQ